MRRIVGSPSHCRMPSRQMRTNTYEDQSTVSKARERAEWVAEWLEEKA